MRDIKEMFSVKEKTVLITGSCGFFGKCISKAFLDAGASVILLDRSDELRQQILLYQDYFGFDRVSGGQVNFYDQDELTRILNLTYLSMK